MPSPPRPRLPLTRSSPINQTGYNTNALTTGIPALPAVVSAPQVSAANANTTFVFQPVNANNVLRVASGGTSTFTLTTPTAVSDLALIVTGFNGTRNAGYTLNYVGGTSTTGTFTAPDNFGGPNPAFTIGGRVFIDNSTTSIGQTEGTNPRLYEVDITANGGLALQSIVFTDNDASPSVGEGTGVFAVSGTVVPEPASLGVIGIAGLALLRRRRMA